ncbi:MAG: DUF4332 domain-containing protein [Hyphomicrobiaceae bacterium]
MSLLYRVIYATHANGTHHKLALDALERLTRHDAKAWQRLFLKNVELYLDGSKAPDKEFKDFRNHVLHVRDNYWGGAPEKAQSWYNHLVNELKDKNWPQAVWCAGVLSHYYTDPIHPFHTAQSEAENNIHRAVEWSISRAYDGLKREAQASHPDKFVVAPDGSDWLKSFVCAGAEKANAEYEKLIAHYDINVGVVDPAEGLDPIARELVGSLILYASDGFARVLERAIAEADVPPPNVSLSLDTVLATLNIPLKWVQKKLTDTEDQHVVQAMYDELMATGGVERNLPEDDRQVRDIYHQEVVLQRADELAQARARRPAQQPKPQNIRRVATAVLPPAVAAGTPDQTATIHLHPALNANAQGPAGSTADRTQQRSKLVVAASQRSSSGPKIYLSLEDDIEAAPSIGPKTAARFYAIGIKTVAQFLEADAFEMAEQLDVRYITPESLTDWQDQAHLVMSVPGLRGGHAQLLVGAGYFSVASIAEAEPAKLSADILKFVTTAEGQRVLRDGEPPDIEKIKSWIDNAANVRAA